MHRGQILRSQVLKPLWIIEPSKASKLWAGLSVLFMVLWTLMKSAETRYFPQTLFDLTYVCHTQRLLYEEAGGRLCSALMEKEMGPRH